MAEFKCEFQCTGKRGPPALDNQGNPIYQLYRIYGRYIKSGKLNYDVQYFEYVDPEDKDCTYAVPAASVRKEYPGLAEQWEKRFGKKWDQLYKDGNPTWTPDRPDTRYLKRTFDNTPEKSKQGDLKKSKHKDVFEIPSDDDVDNSKVARNSLRSSIGVNKRKNSGNTSALSLQVVKPSMAQPSASAKASTSATAMLPPPATPRASMTPRMSSPVSKSDPKSRQGLCGERSPQGSPDSPMSQTLSSSSTGSMAPCSTSGSSSIGALPPRPREISRSRWNPKYLQGSPAKIEDDEIEDDPHEKIDAESPTCAARNFVLRRGIISVVDSDGEEILVARSTKSNTPQSPGSIDAAMSISSVEEDLQQDTPTSQRQLTVYNQEADHTVLDQLTQKYDSPVSGTMPKRPQASDSPVPEDRILDSQVESDLSPRRQPTAYEQAAGRGLQTSFEESQREMEETGQDFATQIMNLDLSGSDSQLASTGPSQHELYSNELIEGMGEGCYRLLESAFELTGMPCDGWVHKRKESSGCSWDDLMFTQFMMIVGWDQLILKHFSHGDLPAEYFKNPVLRKKLDSAGNLTKNDICPSIYAQYLVDKDGLSPSCIIISSILDLVELYLKGLNTDDIASASAAADFDSQLPSKDPKWGNATARKGKRRYIEGDVQAKNCRIWVKALRERLRMLPGDHILDRPLVEVGYATKPRARLDEHSRHTSSNYIMNLTHAICKSRFANYSMKQFVVFRLVHLTHGCYAEIIATRLALGYTHQGGGFSHYMAGVSHPGVVRASDDYYADLQDTLSCDQDFNQRLGEEVAKITDHSGLLETLAMISEEQDSLIDGLAREGEQEWDFAGHLEEDAKIEMELDDILQLLDQSTNLK